MITPDLSIIKTGWACKCPKCGEGDLYRSRMTFTLNEKCPVCSLDLAENDSADGPAVFLIFILGSMLVPLALVLDAVFTIPLWVHAVLWGTIALVLTIGSLRPLKAYIIALQYKHLPWDQSDQD
ncbi:MAG: DUF983 domain-containing protein [Alphaproteobacteria bacterium]